jgi:hypothetical protein
MIQLWTKRFSVLCLSLLVMFGSNIVLSGCGEAGKNSETVEESEKESENVNKADDDDDDDERQKKSRSSDKDDDEEKEGKDKD